jgi:hypothetical protein
LRRLPPRKSPALLITTGVFFGDHKQRIVALAGRYSVPAIYDCREFVVLGGLISYGTRFADPFRQGGVYIARILNGAKPADLPVVQPTTFELVSTVKRPRAWALPYHRICRSDTARLSYRLPIKFQKQVGFLQIQVVRVPTP